MHDLDPKIRAATFEWLSKQVEIHGDVLSRKLLEVGFEFQGNRIPLVAPQGIFKPKILEYPLSITTAPRGPYDDAFGEDGLLQYRYRGQDPQHRDNWGLRQAMLNSLPLVYFHGVIPGKYLAVWPVFVVGDSPGDLTFKVAADDYTAIHSPVQTTRESSEGRRAYVTSIVRRRLHQRGFRERVLAAYKQQCSVCRLRHSELLDAAHIIPDSEIMGDPVVTNGISLCKLHHAAYDRSFLGISPDYVVDIRSDLLDEIDGPMLQHGLKELHGQRLVLPGKKLEWPDKERLDIRYQQFRSV